MRKGFLHLSNGMKFEGRCIGAPIQASGEPVFTTGMVGYTKTLTDPSFFRQILVFTYPLMGNYGVPAPGETSTEFLKSGFESQKIHAAGVVVSNFSERAFHWRSAHTLDQWLKEQGIPGLVGVDTRELTQAIRSSSTLKAVIREDLETEGEDLFAEEDLGPVISYVSVKERKLLGKGTRRIALIDCGVKWNIIRQVMKLDCEVELLPWNTDLTQVDCDAWLISNGPGDPQETGDLVSRIGGLLQENRPVFGICLGFQLLALAAGAKTRKLEFGHRGHNQPVQLIGSERGFMTSQNHGYVVIEETLPSDWLPWFRHINDQTLEGIKHRQKSFSGVQFHPESAAGPQDTAWILEEFVKGVQSAN